MLAGIWARLSADEEADVPPRAGALRHSRPSSARGFLRQAHRRTLSNDTSQCLPPASEVISNDFE
jgi:hypothetical protein